MEDQLKAAYTKAGRRLFLLDYDGVLAPLVDSPSAAIPSDEMKKIVRQLTGDQANLVVIISGRDRKTLDGWLGDLHVAMVAEHGAFRRQTSGGWVEITGASDVWKATVRERMEAASQGVPGAKIEEKETSLVWHWAEADDEAGQHEAQRLGSGLAPAGQEYGLSITYGKKIVEVHHSSTDKGVAATWFCDQEDWQFVLAAGDDTTDEDMFMALPKTAYTIKVGQGDTAARLRIGSPQSFVRLLGRIGQTHPS
jgi:trehalose 6-phosphate synthase/phosphatase